MTTREALLAGALSLVSAPLFSQVTRCTDTTDYAWLDGRDTTSTERVYVGVNSFISRVDARSQGAHLIYFGKLDPAGLVTELTVNIWQPGADTAGIPTQVASVRFSPTVVRAMVASPAGRAQVQEDSIAAGSMPYMDGVLVFLELVRRRAGYLGRGVGTVPMLWMFTGGHREVAQVEGWGLDSARITMPQDTFRLTSLSRAGPLHVTATSGRSARSSCHG